jgi:hypothetical protein
MVSMRIPSSVGVSIVCAATIALGPRVDVRAQKADANSIVGAWTLNKDLSDEPPSGNGEGGGQNGGQNGQSRHGGGGGHGGGMRGGYGGGGRGGYGGGGGGRAQMDPEAAARMREAMRDIVNPPASLTIVQSDTTYVLTGPDGRTTRLSADGKKIKDDNTGIERKTKWDGGKLVSEISGAGPGKITQSFSIDPEHRQLHIVAVLQGRDNQARTITHVYDPAER